MTCITSNTDSVVEVITGLKIKFPVKLEGQRRLITTKWHRREKLGLLFVTIAIEKVTTSMSVEITKEIKRQTVPTFQLAIDAGKEDTYNEIAIWVQKTSKHRQTED